MKALISLICLYMLLQAAPAYTEARTITLSDGSTLIASLRGDEYLNWFETESGEIILYDKSHKRFEYPHILNGELKPSGVAYSSEKILPKSAALKPSVTKSQLQKIWRDKRTEAAKQRYRNR